MSSPQDRLRPPPAERFAGPEHKLDFGLSLQKLRGEPHQAKDGHNQATLFHSDTLRLVLFAFQPGGGLPRHQAPGVVMIQPLRGEIQVTTPSRTYDLRQGESLVLQPNVPHDVDAKSEADMLLSVAMAGRRPGSAEPNYEE
ncbi:MAG TPA: cupin domain-containing protein [Gemmatimonadaceae bacterium]|nr:cupin domain-containing protein [Gemmatimonadaceae bacterium]